MSEIDRLHSWNVNYKEAVKIQKDLRKKIALKPYIGNPSIISGADVSYKKENNMLTAVIVLFEYPGFEIIETSFYRDKSSFPYIPGLLSFREIPPLINAYKKLANKPDIIILDAHGIAHPRAFGLASHFGVIIGISTIGCAKKKLCGNYEMPDKNKGSISPLIYKGDIVGSVLRTRKNCNPVFVSPGNLMDIESAGRIVLNCATKYRIPEPTRIAHILSKKSEVSV